MVTWHWSRFMVNWSRGRMVNRCRSGSMVNGCRNCFLDNHWSRCIVGWSRVDNGLVHHRRWVVSRFGSWCMVSRGRSRFVHWGGRWVVDRLRSRSMVNWGRVHDWLVNHRCMVSWCWCRMVNWSGMVCTGWAISNDSGHEGSECNDGLNVKKMVIVI